jgi:hypothetical protein
VFELQHREDSIMDTTVETYKAIIAIAGIRPPNGRGKSYTVETADGNELSIWPDKLGLLRSGEQYEVQIADKENNGRTYHNIIGTPRHLGPYREPKEDPKPKPQPPQPPTNGKKMDQYWTPKPRDPAEQRQIWICALLCRDMEGGRNLMSEQELIERAEIHARVWDALFGVSVTSA